MRIALDTIVNPFKESVHPILETLWKKSGFTTKIAKDKKDNGIKGTSYLISAHNSPFIKNIITYGVAKINNTVHLLHPLGTEGMEKGVR